MNAKRTFGGRSIRLRALGRQQQTEQEKRSEGLNADEFHRFYWSVVTYQLVPGDSCSVESKVPVVRLALGQMHGNASLMSGIGYPHHVLSEESAAPEATAGVGGAGLAGVPLFLEQPFKIGRAS